MPAVVPVFILQCGMNNGRICIPISQNSCFTMTIENLASTISHNEIPAVWRADAESQLATGENVVSALEIDLDTRLRFGKGLVIVTDRRLLARAPGETTWRDCP